MSEARSKTANDIIDAWWQTTAHPYLRGEMVLGMAEYGEGYLDGAAVVFGLMGMAEAIRRRRLFEIALCDPCAEGSPTLSRTDFLRAGPCARCGFAGDATPTGGTWIYK